MFFSVITGAVFLIAGGFSLGLSGGTTGIGPFAIFPLSEVASFRLGMGFLSFEREQEVDTLTYDMEVSLRWFPMILDYNPGGSVFRLSGGFFVNQSTADASYVPDFTVELGGHTYTPDNVGEVKGKVTMQPLSPYLGIGLGSAVRKETGVAFVLDAGIAFTSFNASLNHIGGDLSPGLEEQLQEDLDMEADSLQDSLDDFSVYPVASIGLFYSW